MCYYICGEFYRELRFNMKRLFILITAVFAAFQICASAESDISISVNGELITPEQPPVVINERTLVPVRAVCEALGLNVDWKPKYQEIIISRGSDFVKLGIDYHTINVNDSLSYIDTAPTLVNGVTCVPIRYVVEPFGAAVDWNAETRTVVVYEHSPDEPAATPTPSQKPVQNTDAENKTDISTAPTPSFSEKAFSFYYQSEDEWAFESNGRGYCWVCSYAMIITNALGEKVTPADIAAYNISKSNGGSGNYMASHFGLVSEYGLEFVPALSENSVYFDSFETSRRGATYIKVETDEEVTAALIEALSGNPHGVMVRFEGYPHTMVATGFLDGEIYFNDPASADMENVTFKDTCLGKRYKLTDLSFIQAVAVK